MNVAHRSGGASLGWALRDALAADPRWSATAMTLTRELAVSGAPGRHAEVAAATALHSVTFTAADPFVMVAVEGRGPGMAPLLAAIEAALASDGALGTWVETDDGTASGSWMQPLPAVRDAAAELARTDLAAGLLLVPRGAASADERAGPAVSVRAVLDAARAGAFGPVRFHASFKREEDVTVAGLRARLDIVVSAQERGVGLAVGSMPARCTARQRAALSAELEALGLTVSWSKVQGGLFMLSGGLAPHGEGQPRTSVDEVVGVAKSVVAWAEGARRG